MAKNPTEKNPYAKVHLNTLHPDSALQFNVFIKVGSRYLHYLRQGDNLELNRMQSLKEKRVRHLFILKEDEASYQNFLDQSLERIESGQLSTEEKSVAIATHSKAAVNDMFDDPELKTNYLKTQKLAMMSMNHLNENPDAIAQVMGADHLDKGVFQHSLNVCSLATGIANLLELSAEKIQSVATGALLHDLGKGKLEIDAESSKLSLAEMPDGLRKKFIAHSQMGADMLGDKKYVERDVVNIIFTHEEGLEGKGYPKGIKGMDPLYQIVALANLFDMHFTLRGEPAKKIFEEISSMSPAPYEKDLIEKLRVVLETNKFF